MLKVGEVTTSLHPKNFIIFFATVVLPAPRGPVNGLDALAFAAHTGHRKICTVIDIKREEYAFCLYKPVPGGVVRDSEPEVLNAENLKIKLEEDMIKNF